MSHCITIGVIVVAIAVYPLAMRVLATKVQPTRLKMAELGNKLVKSDTITPSQRFVLGSMMRDAYDFRIAFALAIGFPVFVFGIIFGLVNVEEHSFPDTEDFKKFNSMHSLSIATANPLCFALFVAEMMVFAPILVPLFVFRAKYSGTKPTDMMVLANVQIDRSLKYLPA